ncbi:uncharacterized protein LOC128951636 [Oppia nitens]|uniref:uncharacterized protein LOC128951636 n=1 Tax=Oppia nitens TaxID=1686743 RepID=UPI0023DB65C7|nr:uncharacterized protein LOC128951636 [Oppia nitens]
MDKTTSDVVFIVDGNELPAHSYLLCHKSVVFEQLLSDIGDHREIVLDRDDNINYQSFKDMLRFIYCEHQYQLTNEKNFWLAINVYLCAHKYKLGYLCDLMEQKLISLSNLDNIQHIYMFAKKYRLNHFIKSFHGTIDTKLDNILDRGLDTVKKLNTITDNYLLEQVVKQKHKEIQELREQLNDKTMKLNDLTKKVKDICPEILKSEK